MSLPPFTPSCAALFQREWPAAIWGTRGVPVAGIQRAFGSDVESYLPLLDTVLMSLDIKCCLINLTVLLPPTHPLFFCYRDAV